MPHLTDAKMSVRCFSVLNWGSFAPLLHILPQALSEAAQEFCCMQLESHLLSTTGLICISNRPGLKSWSTKPWLLKMFLELTKKKKYFKKSEYFSLLIEIFKIILKIVKRLTAEMPIRSSPKKRCITSPLQDLLPINLTYLQPEDVLQDSFSQNLTEVTKQIRIVFGIFLERVLLTKSG